MALERGLKRIALARDGRVSSPILETAIAGGLVEGGLEVTRLGLGPTPMTAFAVRALDLDGGLTITASHNPSDENGLKAILGDDRIHGEDLKRLVSLNGRPRPGGSIRNVEILPAYVAALAAAAEGLPPRAVAWDCGNGATGSVLGALTARLPGRHELLHTQVDGRFPNHHPDPAVEDNLVDLKRIVLERRCEVGFAFDGDGDRIGVVDETGEVLWADQLLLFLSRDLLNETPGAAIVADVKCSRLLFDGVAALGGRAAMTASGYALVREAMRREGAVLGGELSGHIFFADHWHGVDDALYVAVRTLAALARSPESLAQFRARLPPQIATPELRILCADPAEVVARTARRLNGGHAPLDQSLGLRVTNADGWWLLRASGTEPKVTCRCEAADEDGLSRLKAELALRLRESGVEPPAALYETS